VQRPTVYNNFPSEKELLAACQAHFLATSPPPAFDPALGLERVLSDLYGWWRENEGMSGNVARDRGAIPALDELMRETADANFDALADALGSDRESRAYARGCVDVRDLADARAPWPVRPRRRPAPCYERTSFL
jgi:hypothetical protein